MPVPPVVNVAVVDRTCLPTFDSLFGGAPEVWADAPGRVNLIGEHTDYQGGFVLPLAIAQRTRVELRRRADGQVLVWSAEEPLGGPPQAFALGDEQRGRGWVDYVQGVTAAAAKAGHRLGGFEARLESDVPVGSGVSSSAALEVALLRALRTAFALVLDDVALALIAQQSETEFVGAPVGVMDQMASSLGDTTSALFLDTLTLEYERVPLPIGSRLLIIDSGVAHRHATGDYRVRREESEAAARALGVSLLRDVSATDQRVERLPEPLRRRARHIVTENARVESAVAAMKRNDLKTLGALLFASHASLRDDYQVSVPELDLLVELARGEPDVYGARMTGGGFGGSVVLLVRRDAAPDLAPRLAGAYARKTGRTPRVLVP